MPGLPVAPPGGDPAADPAPPPRPRTRRRLRRAAGGGTHRRWCCSRSRCCPSRRRPRTSTPSTAGAWRRCWARRRGRRWPVRWARAWWSCGCPARGCRCSRRRPGCWCCAAPVCRRSSNRWPGSPRRMSSSGFVDAIAGDGVPPPDIDARFFWPAFFAQWAWFRDAAGAADLDVVLRWFPPVVVARLGDRRVRAGPVDARRHPRAVGRGLAVRRAQLDRAGLLLAAGDRHRPAADGADLRARPAGDAAYRRRGGAGLAAAAPGSAPAAAAAPLDGRGDDPAEPADAAAPAAAAHLLLRGPVPGRARAGAPAHPVRDHRPAHAAGRGGPVPGPRSRARRDLRGGGVRHHRRPRLLDEPDRAAARQRRRRQRPADRASRTGWPATSGRSP